MVEDKCLVGGDNRVSTVTIPSKLEGCSCLATFIEEWQGGWPDGGPSVLSSTAVWTGARRLVWY
jgi:hypothetical protein